MNFNLQEMCKQHVILLFPIIKRTATRQPIEEGGITNPGNMAIQIILLVGFLWCGDVEFSDMLSGVVPVVPGTVVFDAL